MLRTGLIILTALALGGCGSLLPKGGPAPRLYTLNALVAPKQVKEPLPISLKILKPQAAPGLETERIALRKNNNEIDYYADVRWATDAPALLQSALVESFEASHRLRSVSNDLAVLRSDYDLLIELRDFQAEYKGTQTETARVRLTAKLINTASDEIIKSIPYEQVEPVKSQSINGIVAAFDRAQQAIAQKLVSDILWEVQHVPVAPVSVADNN